VLVGVNVTLKYVIFDTEDASQVAHDVDGREYEKCAVIDLDGESGPVGGTGGRSGNHFSFDDLVVSLSIVQEDRAADVVACTEAEGTFSYVGSFILNVVGAGVNFAVARVVKLKRLHEDRCAVLGG